jgi:hypothetical protein
MAAVAPSTALRRAGRFSKTVLTGPDRSTLTGSPDIMCLLVRSLYDGKASGQQS